MGTGVEAVQHGARLRVRPDEADVADLVDTLGTDVERGLSLLEATERFRRWGPNALEPQPAESVLRRLARGFAEPMSLLLVVAAAVSGLVLGEQADAIAIVVIVVMNAVIAAVQEGRASRALESLRSIESPAATVIREGRELRVAANAIVIGDILVLRAGERVPADSRLIEAAGLEIDESLLTGESVPVLKTASGSVSPVASLAERRTMVFDGTLATRGSGRAIVVATGMGSELGAIAGQLVATVALTPLQRQLRSLAVRIGIATIAIAAGVVALIAARGSGEDLMERAFLVGVALAVAAVPEGLAAVTTVTLALGVKRMADRGGIVRRLPAVETLGSTTVLAIDKTGTLTENRMRVAAALPAVSERFAEVAGLCSDASPPAGDPLELALIEAAGADVVALRRSAPRVASIPFDADRRRMTTVHRLGDGFVVAMKGAPEAILGLCTHALRTDGTAGEMDLEASRAASEALAHEGLRVLALAYRDLPDFEGDVEAVEHDLTLVAIVGLEDPVRQAAPAAIRAARSAGMAVVMVTGDHPATASAVARAVGLADAGSPVLTGTDLRRDGIPDDPIATVVYARVDPDQKLAIVERLQELGHVVAVTGDGVNDAPALRRADIGLALGRSGTEVAREAADLVITDDDLTTMVAAVREGRGIYANVRKVVDYLLACNLSEVGTVLLMLVLFPDVVMPLLPLQLLWMNLVTDGLPALALGVDPTSDDVMRMKPRPPSERLLDRTAVVRLAMRGAVISAGAVATFAGFHDLLGHSEREARAAMFTVLVLTQLIHAFSARQFGSTVFERVPPGALIRSIRSNGRLTAATTLGAILQFAVVQWPPAGRVFGTVPVPLVDWALIIGCAAAIAFVAAAVPARFPWSTRIQPAPTRS